MFNNSFSFYKLIFYYIKKIAKGQNCTVKKSFFVDSHG